MLTDQIKLFFFYCTWVKATAVHVCLVSFRLIGTDIVLSSFPMAVCHICLPCFFFCSSTVGLLWCRELNGLTAALEPVAGPGRPCDRKAGSGTLDLMEGAVLGVSPLLKNPDRGKEWWSNWTTLTSPRENSSGPLPDDSESSLDIFKMFLSKKWWGNVNVTAVQLDRRKRQMRTAMANPKTGRSGLIYKSEEEVTWWNGSRFQKATLLSVLGQSEGWRLIYCV